MGYRPGQREQSGRHNRLSSRFDTPQTITLYSSTLELTDTAKLTITGPGASLLTVNGSEISGGVFEVTAGATAALTGLTITGGSADAGAGGGVFNDQGRLTLADAVISGNTGNKGGGLYSDDGTSMLTGCTISGNTAAVQGGGLALNGGVLSLTDCTISGNKSGFQYEIGRAHV